MPDLRVGLHLVVVEGAATLPGIASDIMDAAGRFSANQLLLGVRYYFSPRGRRQLANEIAAQFRAFRATGLPLDHANAHKHMHLHPTVGRMMIRTGAEFGLRAVRVPSEPGGVLRKAGGSAGWGGTALRLWTTVLRDQARRAGMVTNDRIFGLAWSGHMTSSRVLGLLPHIPPGLTEIYFHPAASRDPRLETLMPKYEHKAELAALLDPRMRPAMADAAITLTTYGQS